jgi:hypothetical protein
MSHALPRQPSATTVLLMMRMYLNAEALILDAERSLYSADVTLYGCPNQWLTEVVKTDSIYCQKNVLVYISSCILHKF